MDWRCKSYQKSTFSRSRNICLPSPVIMLDSNTAIERLDILDTTFENCSLKNATLCWNNV